MSLKRMLSNLDIIMLSLMIISLPSVEGPKNIFLVGYLITRFIAEIIQFRKGIWLWGNWDSIFAIFVFTALLSTIFAGFSGLEEWKGYKVLLTAILTGWFLSRSYYKSNQYQLLFKLIILSTLLPLFWGLYEYFVIHSRKTLEIHSVGHVNHSAIYLAMIFGASLAWCLSQFNTRKEKIALNRKTILLILLSLLFFISLIIGQSRGAFGIAIILGLMLIFTLAKNKTITILGVLSIGAIIIFTLALNTSIVQKQSKNQENHNVLAFRDRAWNVSLEAARFYPALGIGMSNWHFITLDQIKASVEKRGEIFGPENYYFGGHAHNLYLSALVERGIVGLMVTLFFMIAWIRHLIKTFHWAKKSNNSSYLWGGSLSAWVATFGIGFVNTTFHHEHAILACLFLGIYLSYFRLFGKRPN
jgi:O-antigen ligase